MEQRQLIASVRQQTTRDPTDAHYAQKMQDRFSGEVGGAAADPSDVQYCSWCTSAFTLTKRKHRCRLCQLSYCDECSQRRVRLDVEQIRQFEVANERGLLTRCATAARELVERGRNWVSALSRHAHTHTHTHREREREGCINVNIFLQWRLDASFAMGFHKRR